MVLPPFGWARRAGVRQPAGLVRPGPSRRGSRDLWTRRSHVGPISHDYRSDDTKKPLRPTIGRGAEQHASARRAASERAMARASGGRLRPSSEVLALSDVGRASRDAAAMPPTAQPP